MASTDQHVAQLVTGAEIGSRYRLEAVAGSGGMATVWRAHDSRLGRTVAIKVMSDAMAASPASVTRFAVEARTHARIVHPNLVKVYDYSASAPQPYLVLEYVPGCTLSQRLDQGALDARELKTLARDLLSALACVHDHGVLHRDIKPANVLLDPSGSARLTDFGIARLEDSTRLTLPGDIVGTMRFLAPELLEGDPPTRQSDLFALGVLLRTAAGTGRLERQLQRLTEWLTHPGPALRPADAHAALSVLASEPTATSSPAATPPWATRIDQLTRSDAPTRLYAATRFRAWRQSRVTAGVAASLALLVVLVLAVPGPPNASSVSGTRHHDATAATRPTAYTKSQQRPPTLETRLNELGAAVRTAAKR